MTQVRQSEDFRRIHALPIREWSAAALEEVRAELTLRLKREGTTYELNTYQALMLLESWAVQGLFAHVGVGTGKTLTSALIPTLVECERPAIMVPARLRDKTEYEIDEWRQHFDIRADIRVMKYSELSRADGPRDLLDYKPDLIVLDEAHMLKNYNSARTKRFTRYVEEYKPKIFAMSGTLVQGKLSSYSTIAKWALGDGSPFPHKSATVKEWGLAIDSHKSHKQQAYATGFKKRASAGALVLWAEKTDLALPDPQRARKAVFNRVSQTEGVVMTLQDSCDQPLSIAIERDIDGMEVMDEHFSRLKSHAEGPNGEEYVEQIQIWQVGRQLSMGFYNKWVPKPPPGWYEARREFNALCRREIAAGRADTPLQAANRNSDAIEVLQWRAWREQVSYDIVPVWLTDSVVDYAIAWAHETGGLVWCESVALGARINKKGLPYFGAGYAAAERLKHHEGPCALSIAAHATGRNLQRYSKNLVLSCPPNGALIEQLMGRTHRQGQKEVVSFEFLAHTEQMRGSLVALDMDSLDLQEISQQPQKLQLAHATLVDLLLTVGVCGATTPACATSTQCRSCASKQRGRDRVEIE